MRILYNSISTPITLENILASYCQFTEIFSPSNSSFEIISICASKDFLPQLIEMNSYHNLFRIKGFDDYLYRIILNIKKPYGEIDLNNFFFAFEYQNKNIPHERSYGSKISNFYYKLYHSKSMPYTAVVLEDPLNSENLDITIDFQAKYFDHFHTDNNQMWFKVMAIYFQTSSFEGRQIYLNDFPNFYNKFPDNPPCN